MKTFPVIRVIVGAGVIVVALAVANFRSPRTADHAIPVVRADSDTDSGCTLASLKGSYAVSRQGTLLTSVLGLPAPALWGEVAGAVFDGSGSFSGNATVNVGGAVLNSVPFTGTYTVNSDCTGTVTVNANVGVTLHKTIVVTGGGRGYIETQTDTWAVVQGSSERIAD